MKNVKLARCLVALLVLSLAPMAWSDETTPDPAAPPATSDVSNEGVPPAPVADPGMGSPEATAPVEAPAEKPMKKKKKAAKAAKKKAKKEKKKKKHSGTKAKKKKKKHNNY